MPFKTFCRAEDGAVTVDWVVLTAMIMGLALMVVMIVRDAAIDPAEGLGTHLTTSARPTFGL